MKQIIHFQSSKILGQNKPNCVVALTDDEGYHPDIRVSPNSANKITYNSRGTRSAGTVVVSIPYRYCENDDDCVFASPLQVRQGEEKNENVPKYNSECKNRCP